MLHITIKEKCATFFKDEIFSFNTLLTIIWQLHVGPSLELLEAREDRPEWIIQLLYNIQLVPLEFVKTSKGTNKEKRFQILIEELQTIIFEHTNLIAKNDPIKLNELLKPYIDALAVLPASNAQESKAKIKLKQRFIEHKFKLFLANIFTSIENSETSMIEKSIIQPELQQIYTTLKRLWEQENHPIFFTIYLKFLHNSLQQSFAISKSKTGEKARISSILQQLLNFNLTISNKIKLLLNKLNDIISLYDEYTVLKASPENSVTTCKQFMLLKSSCMAFYKKYLIPSSREPLSIFIQSLLSADLWQKFSLPKAKFEDYISTETNIEEFIFVLKRTFEKITLCHDISINFSNFENEIGRLISILRIFINNERNQEADHIKAFIKAITSSFINNDESYIAILLEYLLPLIFFQKEFEQQVHREHFIAAMKVLYVQINMLQKFALSNLLTLNKTYKNMVQGCLKITNSPGLRYHLLFMLPLTIRIEQAHLNDIYQLEIDQGNSITWHLNMRLLRIVKNHSPVKIKDVNTLLFDITNLAFHLNYTKTNTQIRKFVLNLLTNASDMVDSDNASDLQEVCRFNTTALNVLDTLNVKIAVLLNTVLELYLSRVFFLLSHLFDNQNSEQQPTAEPLKQQKIQQLLLRNSPYEIFAKIDNFLQKIACLIMLLQFTCSLCDALEKNELPRRFINPTLLTLVINNHLQPLNEKSDNNSIIKALVNSLDKLINVDSKLTHSQTDKSKLIQLRTELLNFVNLNFNKQINAKNASTLLQELCDELTSEKQQLKQHLDQLNILLQLHRFFIPTDVETKFFLLDLICKLQAFKPHGLASYFKDVYSELIMSLKTNTANCPHFNIDEKRSLNSILNNNFSLQRVPQRKHRPRTHAKLFPLQPPNYRKFSRFAFHTQCNSPESKISSAKTSPSTTPPSTSPRNHKSSDEEKNRTSSLIISTPENCQPNIGNDSEIRPFRNGN